MAYVRAKLIKGHRYYYLVESYRRNGKVKTRTLKYLGATPTVPPELLVRLHARQRFVQLPLL
jgi:hypothetical protein